MCLTLGALLVPAASAHRGGMAADGCHNHRASGTCHCHLARASRPGCASEYRESGEQRAVRRDETPSGTAGAPADTGNAATTGTPPAPAQWIRIATWNLNRLHWRAGGALWRGAAARSPEDYRTLARYARFLDADVIAFQEVNGPRAAALVFPSGDYDLHFSGRYDARYDDIYNGFAVRKGTFDQVVKRDHEALGLGSGSRYQLRWGVDLTVSRDGRKLRLLNVHLKSKCFAKSLTNPRSRACRTLARQVEPLEAWIDARWREGVRSWCWGTSTASWTGMGSATTCGQQSPTTILRDLSSIGCRQAVTRRAGEVPNGTIASQSTSSCSVRAPGNRWTQGPSGRSSGPDSDADPRRGLPSDHCPIAVDLF